MPLTNIYCNGCGTHATHYVWRERKPKDWEGPVKTKKRCQGCGKQSVCAKDKTPAGIVDPPITPPLPFETEDVAA